MCSQLFSCIFRPSKLSTRQNPTAEAAMAKDRPIPYLRRVRIIEQYDDPETGRCMVRVEWPDESAKPWQQPPKPWRPTQKQGVILAIVKRHYRKGIPDGVAIAALHRLVEDEWKAECARQKLTDPKFATPPGRDMVAYTLRAASLIS
jgi:hypothetical protein